MTAVNQLTLKYLDEQNVFSREDRFNIDLEATQQKFQELVARKIEEKKGLAGGAVEFSYHHKADQNSHQQYQKSQALEVGHADSQVTQAELQAILEAVKEEKNFWVVAE